MSLLCQGGVPVYRLLTVCVACLLFLCNSQQGHALSAKEIKNYKEQGFLVITSCFNQQQMAALTAQVEAAISAARKIVVNNQQSQAYSSGTLFVFGSPLSKNSTKPILRIVWAGAKYPALLALGRSPCLTKPVAELLGSDKADHLINQIHPKLPGDGVDFIFHRDIDNRKSFDKNWKDIAGNGSFIQTLIAVDEMDEHNGGVFIFPGSHSSSVQVKGNEALSKDYYQGRYGNAQPVKLKPGDALFFHPCLVHYSRKNDSNKARRAFINGYAYPGANHASYPGNGSAETIILK